MHHLAGKSVVITGAGRGIGAACARLLGRSGANVVVNDVDPGAAEEVAGEIRATGGIAIAEVADITSYDAVGSMVARCVREFGRLDGLVNNAGLIILDLINEVKEDDLRRMVEVNVIGLSFCAMHASRQMIAQKSGAIVNVSSGAHTGSPTMSVYAATKGAVATYTYSWAMELEQHGIRVNGLLPMADSRMRGITDGWRAAKGLAPHPAAVVSAESNAPVVEFLLSDAARGVNGQLVKVTGSQLALMTHPAQLYPVLERPSWDFDSIDAAFRTEFAGKLQPLGTATLDVRIV